jgi:hypothetical protein
VLVVVPLCMELAFFFINRWDTKTDECWWEIIADDERDWGTKLAVALVLCALTYGVFWLATQG